MKKIITFLLSLIIAYSPIYAFAGAAERQESIYDVAMKSRNGIGVSNVRAANDMINADITQRVTVDGSNATINTKVSIPANDDSFKRNTAKYAKNLLKGGAVSVGAALAMESLLNGVDYVMGEGGQIQKKPNPNSDESAKYSSPVYYSTDFAKSYSSYQDVAEKSFKVLQSRSDNYHSLISIELYQCGRDGARNLCVFTIKHNAYRADNPTEFRLTIFESSNPDYKPDYVPKPEPVPDGEMEDAFFNWFKNNPGSVTDPVTTYIYSGKSSNGTAVPSTPQGTDPSFGQREITDEMMNNYMEHRNANLRNAEKTTVSDSTQTDTSQDPDGSKTTTTTNPDGSKTTTRTDTKTDPYTGEITTTVTETTTMPDGSTSTKTETSTQTKPKPETTELPAFCEYAATLCTWMNRDTEHKVDEKSLWEKITDWFDWTKEEPDSDNSDNEVDTKEPEKFDTAVFKKDRFNVSKQCPSPETHTINLSGISVDFSFDLTPICTVLEFARPALIACSYLYAAYIVIGAARG